MKFLFLQGIIVLIAGVVITLLILFPLTEGRAARLDLIQIYLDFFILYIYSGSFPFFDILYRLYKLLENSKQNELYSQSTLNHVKRIKIQLRILTGLIFGACVYIVLFHHPEDDPAGFIGLSILMMIMSFTLSFIVSFFEKKLHLRRY